MVARQSLQSIGTNNHCTWCHSKVVACSVPTVLWLVVTLFTLAICKIACMFTFVLLRFSVIQFNWSLLTLQGVVLFAMACPVACPVALWLLC